MIRSIRTASTLLLVLAALLGCGLQRKQRKRVLEDLQRMQQAMIIQIAIPEPSDDPGCYGKAETLVHDMYGHLVQAASLNEEFRRLLAESERWPSPSEWRNRKKIKEIRIKAERMVAVIDAYSVLAGETTGPEGLQKVRAMKLGFFFNRAFERGLADSSDLARQSRHLMATARIWAQGMVQLIRFVDENLVKMDGSIPKFGNKDQAVEYRIQRSQVQEGWRSLGELAQRYAEAFRTYRKDLGIRMPEDICD